MRYLNPHKTRHTYASWLRSEGFTIEERQYLMGHEDVRTTQRYGELMHYELTDKIAALA